jgi:hypothetical protein
MGLENDALFCFIKGGVFLRCLEVKLGREQVILDLYDKKWRFQCEKVVGTIPYPTELRGRASPVLYNEEKLLLAFLSAEDTKARRLTSLLD